MQRSFFPVNKWRHICSQAKQILTTSYSRRWIVNDDRDNNSSSLCNSIRLLEISVFTLEYIICVVNFSRIPYFIQNAKGVGADI